MTVPPRWPLKLLRLFIKGKYLEEIEGDMEEIFRENAEKRSISYAKRAYVIDTLKLLRPILIKGLKLRSGSADMFANYFKISYRSLFKNPLTSFINVFGLSVALGICLVVYAYMEYDYNIDQFHENKHKVYLATFFSDRDGDVHQYGLAPRPLGEMLRDDFAQVKKVCRVEDRNVVVKYNDNVFRERVRYTDPEFLEMLTFPLTSGSARSLGDLNSIILSHDMAVKYFGDEEAIGKELTVIFSENVKKTFRVAGVAKEFPKSHDIDFDFLLNFENIKIADQAYDLSDWASFSNAALVQIDDPSLVPVIEKGMDKYLSLQNQAQPDWTVSSFALEPLSTLHERSANIRNAIVSDGNVEGRIGMPIIAIFMIVLACFNYINIAIVSAAKRLKEIGIRKVIGANRIKVAVQFITENVVITSFALTIGLALAMFVFVPWFVSFSGWPLELKLVNQNLWIFIIGLLMFTGIASGIYPAIYISRFDAVKIFKGSLRFGRKNPLTKVFLALQLIVACVTITAGVVFTQNNSFQYSRSWGYNQNSVLYSAVPDHAAFERLKASMIQDPNIISISGSADHLGKSMSTAILRKPSGEQYEVSRLSVDANYINTMEMELIAGRSFNENSENDYHSIIVNELFLKNVGIENPIGLSFGIDSMKYEVIGVLKDFHAKNFFNKVTPTILTLAREDNFRFISFRVKPGTELQESSVLQENWAKLYPEIPFLGGHQEDVWSSYFHSVDRSERFNNVIATIAVLLASLGLYGLVTLNVSGRVREFSIRKALGAGIGNITSVIVHQYILLTVIALVIGAPVSYIFTRAYLDMLFAYPMPMGYSGVIIALVILVCVMLAVIFSQVIKLIKLNAVEGLKAE